jgi:hypothetical protein
MDLRHFRRQGMETAETNPFGKNFSCLSLSGTNLLLSRVGDWLGEQFFITIPISAATLSRASE